MNEDKKNNFTNKNFLIKGRPASGKTIKAIEIFKSNPNGLYFTQEEPKKNLVLKIGDKFKKYIFDDCKSSLEVIDKIHDLNYQIDFIIVDYLQLFESFNIENLVSFLNKKDIKLILLVSIDPNNQIRSKYYNDNHNDIFEIIYYSADNKLNNCFLI